MVAISRILLRKVINTRPGHRSNATKGNSMVTVLDPCMFNNTFQFNDSN